MNLRKILGIGTIAIFSGLNCGCITPQKTFETNRNQKYADKNLNKIIIELEKDYNIKIEKVNFKVRKLGTYHGVYYDEDDSTIIKRSLNYPLERKNLDIRNLWKQSTLKGLIQHEIGHDYTYQIIKELKESGKYDISHNFQWFAELGDLNYLMNKRNKIILEGLGEYFPIKQGEARMAKKMLQKDIKYECIEFKIDPIYCFSEYWLGYKIIKPILNKLGVEKGTKAIYSNPLITDEELKNPKKYYKRIIESKK